MKNERIRLLTLLAPVLATFVVALWSLPSIADASNADTPTHKLGRGLAAITTPFLELPGNIAQTSQREGPLTGWTMGVAKGIGMTIVRPIVGIYELASAPWPAPAHYQPILAPEYPWSYFGAGDSSDVAQRGKDYRAAKEAKATKTDRESKLAKR
jgi:putative exosortase-associated protein (TIGR04073 family)